MTKAVSTDPPQNAQESDETGAPAPDFELHLSADKMKVTLTCAAPASCDDLTARIVTQLTEMGISESNILKYAEIFKKVAQSKSPLEGIIIVQGTAPVPQKDSEIIWARDFFTAGFVTDPETGAVDYRERTVETTVSPGDLLAELTSSQPGQDGIDVLGNAIQVAKCQELRIQAASNVRQEDKRYYAESAGQVRFTGSKIIVDDVYTVNGSVGLKTGNIKHPGTVVIMKNIEAESCVEALGNVDVNGYVEDSDIECGGDLLVNGGIIGGEGRTIRCEGSIQARFIKNAFIEAEDDIIVQSTIENSIIKTRGLVRLVSGRIIGGEITALGGIDTGDVGTAAGVNTKLIAGIDFKFSQQMKDMKAESDGIQQSVAALEQKLLPIKRRQSSLDHNMREKLTTLMHQADEMHTRLQEIEDEIKAATGDTRARTREQIVVRSHLYAGTEVTVGLLNKQVNEAHHGPLRVAISEGDIRISQRNH